MSAAWVEAIQGWLAAMRAGGLAETTIYTRSYHLRRLAWHWQPRSPWSITTDDLVAWTSVQSWSRETRRGYRNSLLGFFRWAVGQGRMWSNPAEGLPKVSPGPPSPRPVPEPMYTDAVATASPRLTLMLRLAGEMGLRRGEVAQIHSRDLVRDLAGWSLIVHGKGQKERVVPLPRSLAVPLRMLGKGWAFPGQDQGHLSPRWVGTLISRHLPEGWTMHKLRHRFATQAYSVDHDTFTVQDLLGHASPATTRTYIQLPDESKRRLVAAVSGDDELFARRAEHRREEPGA